mmetsp:Transcript_49540/g.155915  ORF Transcript_49540/g.155915 Transcript_49540/m.155915 type:complete len:309 (+) Transcript_49540:81-1007(+)
MADRCTCRICSRSSTLGTPTSISRSRRPARRKAGSMESGRFVAPNTTIPSEVLAPSSAVSRAATMRRSASEASSRLGQTASISSMKSSAPVPRSSASSRQRSKAALMRSSDSPMPPPTRSVAARNSTGHRSSSAKLRASSVLPVPGGPTSRPPLGTLAPSCSYLAGFFRKSTNSTTSFFACSRPATSANLTLDLRSFCPAGKALPMLKMLRPPGPPAGPPGPPMPLAIARPARMSGMRMSREGKCGRSSAMKFVSFTYWIGTCSRGEIPSSLCSCSSFASKASGVPSWMVSILPASPPGASLLKCTRQ